jgi:hypothetical protein
MGTGVRVSSAEKSISRFEKGRTKVDAGACFSHVSGKNPQKNGAQGTNDHFWQDPS